MGFIPFVLWITAKDTILSKLNPARTVFLFNGDLSKQESNGGTLK